MAGCLDNVQLPHCECIEVGEKRNLIASVTSSVLFTVGWWILIDAAAYYPSQTDMNHAFHTCGVFGTVSLFMINAVSNGQVRGDIYTTGCMGSSGARVWLFLGFLIGFGSLIGSCWILFGVYVISPEKQQWPGVAIFLQNAFIFFASLIYKFGRSEELWG